MNIYETLKKVQEAEQLLLAQNPIKYKINGIKNKETTLKYILFSVLYWILALIYCVAVFLIYCLVVGASDNFDVSTYLLFTCLLYAMFLLTIPIYVISFFILRRRENKRPYSKKEAEVYDNYNKQLEETNNRVNEIVLQLKDSDIPPKYLYTYAISWMIDVAEKKRIHYLSDLIDLYEANVYGTDALYASSLLKDKIKIDPVNLETESPIQQEKQSVDDEPTEKKRYIKEFNITKVNTKDIDELDSMIGLDSVKIQLEKFRATINYEARHGNQSHSTYHMKFVGNPGTGKTTVAKIMAAILYDAGIITSPKYISVNGNDLMGQYTGQTAPTIDALFDQGKNGLIFIDEAYSLATAARHINGSGYGLEAVNQLLTHLESKESNTVVVFGGYEGPMNYFFDINPGLRSRVPLTIFFPDYTAQELVEILKLNLQKRGHDLSDAAMPVLLELFEQKINICKKHGAPFSNGRYARNVSDELHSQHAVNFTKDNTIGATITTADIHVDDLLNLD